MASYIESFCGIAVIFLVLYYYFTLTFDFWKIRGVNGPRPIPVFGNIRDLMLTRTSAADFLRKLYKEYRNEPMVGIFTRRTPILVLQDPDLIKDVLIRDFSKFADRGFPVHEKVKYFEFVGGFDLTVAVKSCFKEALPDDLTASFTWFGREGLKSLYYTCIAVAICDGVCRNRKFDRPTRSDFQMRMQAELKAAKERVCSRKRGPRTKPSSSQDHRMPRSFWNEQQQQEEETDDL